MQPCHLDLGAVIPPAARAKNGTSLHFPAMALTAKRNKPLSWEMDDSANICQVNILDGHRHKQVITLILCIKWYLSSITFPLLFLHSVCRTIIVFVFFKVPSVMWYVTCMTHYSAFTVDGTFNKGKLIPVLKKECCFWTQVTYSADKKKSISQTCQEDLTFDIFLLSFYYVWL